MEDLVKLIGKENLEEIGKKAVELLEKAYKAYSGLDSDSESENTCAPIDIKNKDIITKTSVSLLLNMGLISDAGYYYPGVLGNYRITQKGREIHDKYLKNLKEKEDILNIF